ncbi:sortase, partial [Patescibacteria group bacterium]|nr:sortase [Patescibacteria group bacterium]
MNQTYRIKVESEHQSIPSTPHSSHQRPSSSRHPAKATRWLKDVLGFVGLFIVFFGFSSLVVMGPTLYSKISYYFFIGDVKNDNENLGLPVASLNNNTNTGNVIDPNKPIIKEDKIIIPKINVDAPLVFAQTADNKTIMDALQSGVVHYPGTALPGQVGNAFVTGHSSYYWWSGGEYNRIFTLLDKLQPNDLVYIHYRGEEYIYKMRDSIIVLPKQTEVLKPTATPTLSIMTCVPIGTNLKRLIVRADLISSPATGLSDMTDFA